MPFWFRFLEPQLNEERTNAAFPAFFFQLEGRGQLWPWWVPTDSNADHGPKKPLMPSQHIANLGRSSCLQAPGYVSKCKHVSFAFGFRLKASSKNPPKSPGLTPTNLTHSLGVMGNEGGTMNSVGSFFGKPNFEPRRRYKTAFSHESYASGRVWLRKA